MALVTKKCYSSNYYLISILAILYTGQRDGDGSGASTLHLQHLLIHADVDCLTRRLPETFEVQ